MIWQFSYRDLEVGLRAVGTGLAKDLSAGNGRPQEQASGNRLMRKALGISRGASQVGKDSVVDAVKVALSPNSVVSSIPLDKTILRSHRKRFVRERFVWRQLNDLNICIGQQVTSSTKD